MTAQRLTQLLQQARDQAKTILGSLEAAGHPQTRESSSLYLALVILQKRVAGLPPGASLEDFAPELAQLASMCTDKLAALKRLLDDAATVARGA